MSRTDYETYITSPEWEEFKRRYYSSHQRECVVCFAVTDIHLHHHTYARLGCEAMTDVVALCAEHHAGVHKLHRKKKAYQSLTLSTQDYILKENPNSKIRLLHNPSQKFVDTSSKGERVTRLKTVQRGKRAEHKYTNRRKKNERRAAARNAKRADRKVVSQATSSQPVVSSGYRGPRS